MLQVRPLRLGIQHDPLSLVVEYTNEDDGDKRQIHHIPLNGRVTQHRTRDLVAALQTHPQHGPYVRHVQVRQLGEYIRRLRQAANGTRPDDSAIYNTTAGPAGASAASRRGRSTPARPPAMRHSAPPCVPPTQRHGISSSAVSGGASRPSPHESWPSSAWASWCKEFAAAGPSEQAGLHDIFEVFRTARGSEDIAHSFARLFAAAVPNGLSPGVVPMDAIRAAVGDQRRLARTIWERLAARRAGADYRGSPLRGRSVVVVGAGPVGLRAALEMRLLGAEVVVLERRLSFERINRLHLWPWTCEDLKGWGAKALEPPELSFGADPDFVHIGIGELQMLLFKCCLLLGVQVFFGAEYAGSAPVSQTPGKRAGWRINVKRDECSGRNPPGPVPPSFLEDVWALVGADGPRSSIAKAHGFDLIETCSLRKGAALGLVVNYANRQTPAEKSRRSFSIARQFYEALFDDCEQETGLALENIVCYISAQTHYFVMTPTKKSLQQLGVLQEDAPDGTAPDASKLARVARAATAFPWKPEERPLPEETLDTTVGEASLFDFSTTRRAASGLRVVRAAAAEGGEEAEMLVGLCGDTLIEPFWPEGLGIMRGFLAALDLASAAKLFAESGDAPAAADHFESAFRQLKSLAAQTRDSVLRSDWRAFSLDPSTRYRAVRGTGGRANSAPPPRHSI